MWKRWWLCHATDFQSLMYPCFVCCRILAIFPYKFNYPTFEISKPRYILSTVIICVCFISNLVTLYFGYKVILESMTKTLQFISYYVFCNFMLIITHVLSGPRMRLLQTLLDISSKVPPQSYKKLSRMIHVKDIFGTIFLAIEAGVYFYKNIMFEVNCMYILAMIFTLYQSLIEFEINMLHINCVCILKACFKRINDNLANMQRLVVNDIKPRVPRLICYTQSNEFLLIKLKILQKQHLMASNTVQMLNLIFSLQILISFIIAFINLTFEIYFYLVDWQDNKLIWNNINLDVITLSLTLYIIKLIIIMWACETGKNQAREIGTTIHDVLNSTNDKQIKYELQQFSLQILHRKNTFSVKGFTVDATLLTSMLGNITTYMLILIQFLIISHSCDKKVGNNITSNSNI